MNLKKQINTIYTFTKKEVDPKKSFRKNCEYIFSKSKLLEIYENTKEKGGTDSIITIPDLVISNPPHNDHTHLFMYMIALLLFLISFFMEQSDDFQRRILNRINSFLSRTNIVLLENRSNTISSEITDRIPIYNIEKIDECPICLETFSSDKPRILVVPCCHSFCSICLKKNCDTNKSKCLKCSICRGKIVKGILL